MRLTDKEREHIPEFVSVVGDALEGCPNAEVGVNVLFRACAEHAQAQGSRFMPLGTFTRLLMATGYKRTHRQYGHRFTGIRPQDPAYHRRVWYWDS